MTLYSNNLGVARMRARPDSSGLPIPRGFCRVFMNSTACGHNLTPSSRSQQSLPAPRERK